MKLFLALILATNLVACKTKRIENLEVVEKEIIVEKEVEVEVEKEHIPTFQGFYSLNGPSDANCIYLDEKFPNIVDLESDCQSLVTKNPENNTLGQFPRLHISGLQVRNNEIRRTMNVRYDSGDDIEEDVSGANISGTKRTDLLFQVVDGKLKLTISIYKNADGSNLNEIVATRTFKEL